MFLGTREGRRNARPLPSCRTNGLSWRLGGAHISLPSKDMLLIVIDSCFLLRPSVAHAQWESRWINTIDPPVVRIKRLCDPARRYGRKSCFDTVTGCPSSVAVWQCRGEASRACDFIHRECRLGFPSLQDGHLRDSLGNLTRSPSSVEA